MIFALPAALATILPFASTVATLLSSLSNMTLWSASLGSILAVILTLSPAVRSILVFEILTDEGFMTALLTLTDHLK